jgi:DinB superfamily
MSLMLDLLQSLRAQRRATVLALRSVREDQLTTNVGPRRSDDVRATLLSLAQDDDQRCATLGEIFAAIGWHPSDAQRILRSLAQTRGQLRAGLVGLTDALLDHPPAPGEWSVRQALQHLMNNERRFVLDMAYAIERLYGAELPLERPDEHRGAGTLGPELPGPVEEVFRTAEEVRDEVVSAATPLGEAELAAATPWAGQEVDIRFMLHRRSTHERQHMVQMLKTLQAIGHAPSEAEMLLGQAEVARGALEGMILGIPDDLSDRIPVARLASIEPLLEEAAADEASKVRAIRGAIG